MTGGQVHDSQVVEEILNTPRSPLAVTADKAYDSEKVRQQIRDEGALPVIPNRCTATKKAYCPKRFYRRRHKIENFFCRIKDWRRIATRYDKLARNFLAATTLVGCTLLDQIVSPPMRHRCRSAVVGNPLRAKSPANGNPSLPSPKKESRSIML